MLVLMLVEHKPKRRSLVIIENEMFLEKGLNRIVVYGKGIVRDAPNVAFVVVGVETEGKEVEQVQTENAEKMQSILSVSQQEGIPNELIIERFNQ